MIDNREVTRSVGGVVHLNRWLSPYVNYAETFNAPSSVQRIDSSFLPATVAKGIDVGLRAKLLGGRLEVTVLRYVNKEQNAAFGATGNGDINNLANANALGDTSPAGRNIRNFGGVPGTTNDLQDRDARGYELESTANLTKQWRLLFNVGLVYQTNAARDFTAFYETNHAIMKQIVIDTGGLVDANDVATVDASVPVNNRSPDVNAAVNSYNNLRVARQNAISGRRITQDQPSVNLFSDYTLGTGRFKGLRLGAGVQYRGKQIIGYRGSDTIVNPANPSTAIDDPKVDAYTPVYAPASYTNVVTNIGYAIRLADKRQVRFDLRANNVFNRQGPIYSISTALRPKGGDLTSPARETVPNVYVYKTPITLNFTTTLSF